MKDKELKRPNIDDFFPKDFGTDGSNAGAINKKNPPKSNDRLYNMFKDYWNGLVDSGHADGRWE